MAPVPGATDAPTDQPNPRLLALETSSSPGSIALAAADRLVADRTLDPAQTHGRDLVPVIDAVLARAGWRPADLDVVAVGIGPGSYTGLRVGLACARTLAYAVGAKLVGIGSLMALAHNAPDDARHIHTVVDAQRADVYLAEFRRQGDKLICTRGPEVVAAGAWSADLPDNVTVLGNGLKRHAHLVRDQACRLLPPERWSPTARAVATLARDAVRQGAFADLFALEPLYMRRPAAVEKWQAQRRGEAR